ncbi:MAG TPA: hypothetical protein VGB42_12575 [Candidatus Thermoplasmatota archaeon]
MAWRSGALLSATFLLACVPATGQAGAAPPEPCSVDVSIDKPYVEATVSSTQPGTASTSGNYTATLPPVPERAVITITAVIDSGWPITISPSTITVSGNAGRTGTFYLTVVVPPAEPVSTALVTVTARMVAGGIECTPSQVNEPTVGVRPYIEEPSLAPSQSLYSISGPDGARAVTVSFASKANTHVRAEIMYSAPEGIHVDGPAMIDVPRSANGTANATFTIRVSAGAAEVGTYTVAVGATASAGDSDPKETATNFSLEVNEAPLPGAGSALALLVIAAAAGGGRTGPRRWRARAAAAALSAAAPAAGPPAGRRRPRPPPRGG